MTATGRILLVAAATLVTAGFVRTAEAKPTKSVRDCNKELDKQRDALEAAGDTPQAFFHRCWWESKPGDPTPVESAKSGTNPKPAARKPLPKRAQKAQVAIKRRTPQAGRRRDFIGSRGLSIDEAPPEPAFIGPPPPSLLAERPPIPLYRPMPRVCVNLGPITAGVVRGRPCVPLPIGPGLDLP